MGNGRLIRFILAFVSICSTAFAQVNGLRTSSTGVLVGETSFKVPTGGMIELQSGATLQLDSGTTITVPNGSLPWAALTGQPTTLSGYGVSSVPSADLSGTIPTSNLAAALQTIVTNSGTLNLSGTSITLPSLSQTLVATAFSGNGSAVSALNATNVSNGTLNDTYTYHAVAQSYFNSLAAWSETVTGGSTTTGLNTVNVTSTASLNVGQIISGTGIPANTVITEIRTSTLLTISQLATATGSSLTFTVMLPPMDRAEKKRISMFCQTLDDAGILTSLVDAAFLRRSQNNGTITPVTLRGALTGSFHGGTAATALGMVLDGATAYGDYTTPSALTANTVAMTYSIPPMWSPGPNPQAIYGDISATMIEFGAQSGYTSACLECLTGNGVSGSPPNGWCRFTTAQASTTATSADIGNGSSQNGISIIDPLLTHNLALSTDDASSPTVSAWIDGNQTYLASTGMVQATSSCTRLVLGNRNTGTSTFDSHWWNGTINAFAIFSVALTNTQEDALMVALRWLEPQRKNYVFYGDSITSRANGNPNTKGPWWQQSGATDRVGADARIYNLGVGGATANSCPISWAAGMHPLRPRGAVEATTALGAFGSNDIRGDTEGALGTEQSFEAMSGYARADGIRYIQTTILPAGDYTTEQEAQRKGVNAWIVGQNGLTFDGVFAWDTVLGNTSDLNLWNSGGIHPTDLGNSKLANAFARASFSNSTGNFDEHSPLAALTNFQVFNDGVATASSTTFTSATANFSAYDVGATLTYYSGGYGIGDVAHTATISSVTNSSTVVLSGAPSATVSPCDFTISGRLSTNAELFESGRMLSATITGNTTLCNPSNPCDGQLLVYCLTEDGTGSHSVTLDSAFSSAVSDLTWDSSTAQGANSVRYLTVRYSFANTRWDILGIAPPPILPITKGGTGVSAKSFVFAIQGSGSNVSLTNSTFTNIPFNSTVHDNLGEFSGGIYTLKQAGLVKLKTRVWMDNGNGTVDIMIKKNAGTFYQEFHAMPGPGTNQCTYGADTYDIGAIGDAYSVYVDTPNTGSNAYGNAAPLTFFYAETNPF